ncbi:MAG: integrase [Nitrospinaceae bacterium]|nr:MAG: integrase [Nitrospinaceae bacterium]
MANIEKRLKKNGSVVYRVKVRLKGNPSQSATFERITDAKKWVQNVESDIREGRHFKTTEAKRHSLGEMIDRYLRDVLPQKSEVMQRDQYRHLQWWKEQLGHKSLADITSINITEYRDQLLREPGSRKKKRSSATVVRYMAALSHAFNIAVREWGWLDDSPMRKVTKPKEPRGRVRLLNDDERERLMKACRESDDPFLYSIVILALSTGARKSEILNLEWGDIDLSREVPVAILYKTKNDERRALPLAGHALEIVKNLSKVRRLDTNLLFPDQSGKKPITIRTTWEKALKKADVKDFRFHDLRHSAASYLAMSGASLAEIAEVLGHKTLQMVKRYSHLSEQHTASVVEKMNKKIFG